MKLWRSECGEMCLVIPAPFANRFTIRVAAWRFRRLPAWVSSRGPDILSPAARSTARATRGGRGITASLEPFPRTVTVRWPRSRDRASILMEHASDTRRPSSPRRHARAWSIGPRGCPLGDEGTELQAIEAQGGRLGVDLGASDVLGRRVLDEAVEDADPVEAGHRRQPPSDGGPGQSPLLHGAGPQLDVAPLGGEDLKIDRGAPGKELAQVAHVALAGRSRVPGQEAGHGQAGLVEQ